MILAWRRDGFALGNGCTYLHIYISTYLHIYVYMLRTFSPTLYMRRNPHGQGTPPARFAVSAQHPEQPSCVPDRIHRV
jgi:hypothetical protein